IGVIDDYDIGGGKTVSVQTQLQAPWNDWELPAPSNDATSGKSKFITALSRPQQEAEGRCTTAGDLQTQLNGLHDNLIASETTFESSAKSYEAKYGTTSQEMKDLQSRFDSLTTELAGYRKKEQDEVIVLGSSPVYLILWPFGPLIMAGI